MLLAQIEKINTISINLIEFKDLFVVVCLFVLVLKNYCAITFDTVVTLLWGRA